MQLGKPPVEPRFFLYSLVNENDTKKLGKAITNMETRMLLGEMLKVEPGQGIGDILLDFHFNNFQFAKEQLFSNEKLSCLLGILDFLFRISFTTRLSMTASFERFKDLLLKHSVHRPPRSMAIFSLADVKAVTDYALKTFFRHYSFYEFVLLPREQLSMATVGPQALPLPALARLDGVPELNPREIDDLKQYLEPEESESPEEEENEEAKLEAILMEEMRKISSKMENKLHQMDGNIAQKVAKK